jgi:Terpene cyclase DEP1
MTALLIHFGVGLAFIAFFFYANAYLYKGGWQGAGVTGLEALYYLIAVCSFALGYYFNVQYVQQYPAEAGWVHFTKLLFTNPAASSGSQDLVCTNVILFPLWTIIDGRRLGMKQPWVYFVLSLLTSFGFGFALYLAAHERQIRRLKAHGQAARTLAA